MGKKQRKTRKRLYPRKALVPIYWVAVGISFILVFTLPINSYNYSYTFWMVLGLILWIPFMVGAILYSNYYQRQGIRKCPNCGKYAYKGKIYCERCGARIFWQCPKCHARTSYNLEFCKECGQKLNVVTFARQIEFEENIEQEETEPIKKDFNVVVTGSIVQFCPACGAEISEDLTHCSICGSRLGHQ